MKSDKFYADWGTVGRHTPKLFLAAVFLFILIGAGFAASGSFTCYQETANVSTSCGGLANGSYSTTTVGTYDTYPSSIDPVTCLGYMSDGSYASYCTPAVPDAQIQFYVNYSKPAYSLNSSVWQVKVTHNASSPINSSFNSSCWNAYSDRVVLRVKSNGSTPQRGYGECYNGTDWAGNYSDGSGAGFSPIYEEAIYWNLSTIIITPIPIQTAATKNNLVKWNDSVTITGGSGTCLYNITQLGVQNNTTISIVGNSSITNSGNYTNLNFSCNSTSSPYNITFYTEAPNETSSTVSYSGLGGVQTRFYVRTQFNNSLDYSLTTNASTIQGLRVWKCDQLTNISCNASGTWGEQTNYTLSGTTVNYTYNMNSNESVVIVSWDSIGGGGGLIGGGGGGGISVLPCILPNMMVNGSCIAPAPLPGELPSIPGAMPFGQAIDGFLRGVSFGIPNAWLIIVALLFFIAEGMPRYFAGQSSGLLTVLSLFGIALIGFYYKTTLGLGI